MKSFYTNTAERLVREVEHNEEAVLPMIEGFVGPLTREQMEVWAAALPELPPPGEVPPVPVEVPLWSLRAACAIRGLLPLVSAGIASLPEPARTLATQQWEYSNWIERAHPLIEALGAGLGLGPEDLDDLFREAATLY